MSRGRPPAVDSQIIIDAIIQHKDEVISKPNNVIVSERHPVWTNISQKLLNKIKPASLYSYVANDRFNLKKLLLGISDVNNKSIESVNPLDSSSSSISADKSNFIFILTFGKAEFENLIIETSRKYRDKKGIERIRIVNVLHPQKWTEIMFKKIYDDFRLLHGYHFEKNHINQNKDSGGFSGTIFSLLI